MYHLTQQQVDFILNDIRTRGIERASLQHDLLDHICCVVEHELDDGGDFERFYQTAITRFFRKELREIEEQTAFLLTNKNHFVMKKTMIVTGSIATPLLAAGIILKFLHLPGAAVLIVLGIFLLSFIFLPLMFILRMREKNATADKAISILGGISGILTSLGVLFKIMHWPGANLMSITALLIMLLVFIPVYFFTGLRNPENKTNTVVSSMLMFFGCVLVLTLIRSPQAFRAQYVASTASFIQADRIAKQELALAGSAGGTSKAIYDSCEKLKRSLLKADTGTEALADDFEAKETLLSETSASDYFGRLPDSRREFEILLKRIGAYNRTGTARIDSHALDMHSRLPDFLAALNQVQLLVLQQRRTLAMN
jgi:hypothetical protein